MFNISPMPISLLRRSLTYSTEFSDQWDQRLYVFVHMLEQHKKQIALWDNRCRKMGGIFYQQAEALYRFTYLVKESNDTLTLIRPDFSLASKDVGGIYKCRFFSLKDFPIPFYLKLESIQRHRCRSRS